MSLFYPVLMWSVYSTFKVVFKSQYDFSGEFPGWIKSDETATLDIRFAKDFVRIVSWNKREKVCLHSNSYLKSLEWSELTRTLRVSYHFWFRMLHNLGFISSFLWHCFHLHLHSLRNVCIITKLIPGLQ